MNKKLLFILLALLLFAIQNSKAQQDDEYKHLTDSLFQHLNKLEVTTGVLYDRVFPLSGLNTFNLIVPDTSSKAHFIQAYSEYYRSAFNPSNSWLTIQQLKENITTAKINGQVPIGLGNYQFNVIDTNAIALNLIRLEPSDSLYYDVSGRPRSPYHTINSFVAAALVDSVKTGNVAFFTSAAFTLNYSNKTLTNLSIDFGDGMGLQNMSLSGLHSVYYSNPGYVNLKFIATFSDNSTITTYTALKVYGAVSNENLMRSFNNCDLQTTFDIWSKLSFQGYDENMATKGKGDVTIYHSKLNNCDGIIRKPVIIIDGFDPGNGQDAKELYDNYLNSQKGALGDSLRNKGYDIFILDFPSYQINGKLRDGGADFIERNARVLMALIDTVNLMKQGNEKLVIIGPSMGGLISRYALAYMEQHNMIHNTRLWVSFDSPHQGANIPLGDQQWLDFYAIRTGSEEIVSKRDGKIGSVAAKQMLMYHYMSSNHTGADGFRDRFLNDLNTLGFPIGDPNQPFRKISLVDGSLGGTEINYAGQKGFTFDVRKDHSINLFLFKIRYTTLTVSSSKMYFTPSYSGDFGLTFDGWFLNRSNKGYAFTPSNTSGIDVAPGGIFNTQAIIAEEGNEKLIHVLGGLIRFRPRFYSVIPNHSFINTKGALAFSGANKNLSENISNRSLVCTGETPFDSYFGDLNKNRDHVELWPQAVDYVLKEIDGIPQLPLIKSNLTISGPVQQGGSTTYSIANLPAGATVKWEVSSPYAINGSNIANPVGIVIPSNNSQFAELIATVSTNCYQTIVTKQLVPPNITTALSGSNGVCGEGYAIINVPSGVQFTWTATGDISIEGQGQSYATTSNTINVTGTNGLLTCKFLSFNNIVTTYKEYAPYSKVINVAANPMLNSDPLSASILNVDYSYTSIKWYIDGTLVNTGNDSLFDTSLPDCGNHVLSAEAELSCGATVAIGSIEIERYCVGWFRNMVIYPNPAISTNLFVSLDETKMARVSLVEKGKMKEYEAWLYDDKGRLKKKTKSKNLKIELNTTNLPSGTYFLHMLMEGTKEIIKKQVIIRN